MLLDRLKVAAASPGDGKALVRLWDEASPRLSGVAEGRGYEKLADSWRGRIRTATEYIRVYSMPAATERELADAWQAVMAAGLLHPSLTDAHRKRGEEAVRRAPLLEQLRRVPNIASCENDRKLVAAWGTGAALAGCREATGFAARVTDANARLALVQGLERAIKLADAGGPEDAVLVAAAKLPTGYAHPYDTRVGEGSEAIRLMAEIQKALATRIHRIARSPPLTTASGGIPSSRNVSKR